MKTVIAAFPLFVGAFARAFKPNLATLTVPLPSEASAYTSTVPACGGTVSAFVVVGIPGEGEFQAGTQTIVLPAQASAATTTIVNTSLNATQVIIATPLEGSCEPFNIPATGTTTSSSSAATSACPLKGCAAGVGKAAESVLEAINKVTLISENLQSSAKQLFSNDVGADGRRTDSALQVRAPASPVTDLLSGLREVISSLSTSIPRIAVLSPFPPGCDTDAIIVALTAFVRVHQALLNIIIGRSGLLENSPFADVDIAALLGADGELSALETRQFPTVGSAIATVLRGVEGVVDQLAFALIDLIPARSQCAKGQKASIDGTLGEAIDAYE